MTFETQLSILGNDWVLDGEELLIHPKKRKHTYLDDIQAAYNQYQLKAKTKIRMKPTRWARLIGWLWFWISFPFIWIWNNIRDWRTAVIFVLVFLGVSSEVWIPYSIAFIGWKNEPLRISMLSVGSACWLFWLGPGTPFLVIVITLTIAIKGLFDKFRNKK